MDVADVPSLAPRLLLLSPISPRPLGYLPHTGSGAFWLPSILALQYKACGPALC